MRRLIALLLLLSAVPLIAGPGRNAAAALSAPSLWGTTGLFSGHAPSDEIIVMRSENSKTFDNHDGTYSSVIGVRLHRKDSGGNWVDRSEDEIRAELDRGLQTEYGPAAPDVVVEPGVKPPVGRTEASPVKEPPPVGTDDQVQVGSGGYSLGGYTWDNYYYYHRSQGIYLSSELGGLSGGGTITALAHYIYVTGTYCYGSYHYLNDITLSTYSNTNWENLGSTVWSGTLPTSPAGWKTLSFGGWWHNGGYNLQVSYAKSGSWSSPRSRVLGDYLGTYRWKCGSSDYGWPGQSYQTYRPIILLTYTPRYDAQAISIGTPSGTVNRGSTIQPYGVVRNNSTVTATFTTYFTISDGYSSARSVTLAPNASTTLYFDYWYAPTAGSFTTQIRTYLSGDVVPSNDYVTGSVFVQYLDAQAYSILSPTGTVNYGTVITPRARIYNRGNTTQTIPSTFYTGGTSRGTQYTTIGAGGYADVTYTAFTNTYSGNITTQVTTALSGDMNSGNNTITGSFFSQYLDAECVSVVAPTGTINQGTAVTPQATVRNNSNTTQTFTVTLTITGGYSNTQTITLGSGASTTVSFANWSAAPAGSQTVTATTNLSGDMNSGNNTKTGTVFVQYLDAEAVSISAPTGTVTLSTHVTPSAVIRNNGNTTQTFNVTFTISTGYSNTQSVTLAAGASTTLSFNNWTAAPIGTWTTSVTTALSGDMNSGNNNKTGSVFVQSLDVQTVAILAPGGTIDSTQYVAPQATVRNNGNSTRTFTVRFDISDGYNNTQTVSNLAAGATATVTFASWTVKRGTWTTKCSTQLSGDQSPANDRVTGSVTVNVHDVQTTTIIAPTGNVDRGITYTPQATVRNNGTQAETFTVRFNVSDGYNSTQTVTSLAAGASTTVSFATWTPSTDGNLATKCSTQLTTDQVRPNDRATGSVFVQNKDAMSVSIVAPTGNLIRYNTYTPQATVRNNGNIPLTFTVRFRIPDDGYNNAQTVTNLAAGATTTVTFTSWTANNIGSFGTQCSTEMTNDWNAANNKVTGACFVQGFDAQATRLMFPTGIVNQGDIIAPRCSVRNNGNTAVTFTARFKINDGSGYNQVQTVTSLAPLTSAQVTFPNWTASALGTWAPQCSTELSGDQNVSNNREVGSVFVQYLDARTTAIVGPTGTINQGTVVVPQATVLNASNNQQTFNVRFTIAGGYTSIKSVTLNPSASTTVSFDPYTCSTIGTFATACTTQLTGDRNTSNDRLTGSFLVQRLDAECVSLIAPTGTIDSGTSVTPQASIRNNGNTSQTFNVKMDIAPGYSNTQSITLAAGATQTLNFAAWVAGTSGLGSYAVKCSTQLPLDMDQGNDRKTGSAFVQLLDAQTVSIIGPTGIINQNVPVTPQASIRNNGNTQQIFNVRFEVGVVYGNTRTCTLAAGATQTVSFASWTPNTLGNFTVKCTTQLTGDQHQGNDKQTGTVFVRRLDVQTLALIAPIDTVAQGATVTPQASLRNNGNTTVYFDAVFSIGSGYTNTRTCTLTTGQTQTVSFAPWNASTLGNLAVKCTTQLIDDMDQANDRLAHSIFVRLLDAECRVIIVPTGDVDSGAAIVPQARVRNNGNTTVTFGARFTIGSVYTDLKTVGTLAPGDSRVINFANWYALPRGTHAVKCTLQLASDQVDANDFQTGSVFVQVFDIEAVTINAPTGTVDSGALVTPQVVLRNRGNTTVSFPTRFMIGNNYNDTQTVVLAAGAQQTTNYSTWTAEQRGSYAVQCTTMLDPDMIHDNDFQTGSVVVLVHDVSANTIIQPSGFFPPGALVPRVVVSNNGTQREPVTVTFRIPEAFYTQTLTLPNGLPLATDTVLAFPSWTATPGTFSSVCSTDMAGDQVVDNNVLRLGFRVGNIDVGVVSISTPVEGETLETTTPVAPAALVKNFGNLAATFRVYFTVDSALAYHDSVMVANLLPEESTLVSFRSLGLPHRVGGHIVRCSTYIILDGNMANDVGESRFYVVPASGDTGWVRKLDLPLGPKGKRVKDGGALAYIEHEAESVDAPQKYVYAFKGNNRYEFYQYNIQDNVWATKESVPAIGRAGKKKAVKKGAALTADATQIYAAKGNNSQEFWCYTPNDSGFPWQQLADIPLGARAVKEGAGAAAVTLGDTTYVYFLKGSATTEFYRYNTLSNSWQVMAGAPLGASGKTYKTGSALTFDGSHSLYALKGAYNEFFVYDLDSNTWTTKTSLPLVGLTGKKKKVKDGAGIAWHEDRLYALKGGNTQEFWKYEADSDRWSQLTDIPVGGGKRVKGGGALVSAPGARGLYAFKGNNTVEFYKYGIIPLVCRPGESEPQAAMGSGLRSVEFGLRAAPNPFSGRALISYALARGGHTLLRLYDVTGAQVLTVARGYRPAGAYSARLDATGLARGIYILKFETDGYSATRKLILE